MLAACNYKAREYGVKAGMPGYQAKALCPEIVFEPVHFERYNYYSEIVMEILSSYDPNIEIYGVDEACLVFDSDKLEKGYKYYNENRRNGILYVDNTEIDDNKPKANNKQNTEARIEMYERSYKNRISKGSRALYSSIEELNLQADDDCSNKQFKAENNNLVQDKLVYEGFGFASVYKLMEKIRAVVFRNTKLTVSAGISVCRGFSKYSSNINKPNGQFMIERDFDSYILDLDVDEINGIGKATKEVLLKAFEIRTIRDLREKMGLCAVAFKPKTFSNLFKLSYGLSLFDSETIKSKLSAERQSVGMTMSIVPTDVYEDILIILWNIAGTVSRRLDRSQKCGITLGLYVKYRNFRSISKRKKGICVLKSEIEIFNLAISLLQQNLRQDANGYWIIEDTIRMLGIFITDLIALKDINVLETYKNVGSEYNPRRCIICNVAFVHESATIFEAHVNKCIDRLEQKPEKKKTGILDYFNLSSCKDK
jgi:DNA polymerase kappa